jgi:hypothetical protein
LAREVRRRDEAVLDARRGLDVRDDVLDVRVRDDALDGRVRDDALDGRVRGDALDGRVRARELAVVALRFLAGRAARRADGPAPWTRAVTLPSWVSSRRNRSSRPTASLALALSLRMSLVIRLRSLMFCLRSLPMALSTGPCAFLRPVFAILYLHPLMSNPGSMIA